MRLAIVASHPIQYQAPWFRALASCTDIDLKVLFCHRATPRDQADAGFGFEFDWDVALLDGYDSRFLDNVAKQPSLQSFNGLDTPELKQIISEGKFDAVIVNGWHHKSDWQTMRACWKTRTPILARSDSILRTERSLAKRATKLPLYRWFIPKLDACLPVGQLSRDYFLHYGAQPEHIFIVPHAVDDQRFANEAARWLPRREELRTQFGLAPEARVFVFAGKFIEKKRPMDFIKAIREAAGRSPEVSGLMVGDGPLRAQCESAAQQWKTPISFTGFLNQSEIARAYIASDVLVLPSDSGETWGLVVNEAMLCGRPCFVSDAVGCAPDLIVSGETGEQFPLGDVRALTELMIRYTGGRQELEAMSDKAMARAARYSVDAAVNGVLSAVNSAVQGNRN